MSQADRKSTAAGAVFNPVPKGEAAELHELARKGREQLDAVDREVDSSDWDEALHRVGLARGHLDALESGLKALSGGAP